MTKNLLTYGAVVLVSFFTGWYFRSNQILPTTSFQNDKLCQEAALRIHAQDAGDSSQRQMEPRFKYIPSLNLCVYKGGFISDDGVFEYLKDAMTNEDLGSYMASLTGKPIYRDKESFEATVRRYFLEAR